MATRDVTAPTALTLKTVLRDYSTGTERLWNTATPGFEAYSSGNVANYGITTTEGSPGSYKWTVPASLASLASGEYKSKTYRIAASNLATLDLPNIVYEDEFWWDGTTFAPPTAGAAPTAAQNAAQVRVELATELARLDATVGSRLASGSYTAPDNSSIAAVKVKTDYLPSAAAGTSSGLPLKSDLPAEGEAIDYTQIQAAANGTVKLSVPSYVDRPTSGTIAYSFDVHTFDETGNFTDADGDPTIKMKDFADSSLATAWTLLGPTKPATGIYRYTFAIPSTYTNSLFRLSAQATVNGVVGFDPRLIAVSIAKVNTATGKIDSDATVTIRVVEPITATTSN